MVENTFSTTLVEVNNILAVKENVYSVVAEWDECPTTGVTSLLSIALCNNSRDYYGYVSVKPQDIKSDWVRTNVFPKLGVLDTIDDFNRINIEGIKSTLKQFLKSLPTVPEHPLVLVSDHPKHLAWFMELIDDGDGRYWFDEHDEFRFTQLIVNSRLLRTCSPIYKDLYERSGRVYNAHEDAKNFYEGLAEMWGL